jgi:hypothetical protein
MLAFGAPPRVRGFPSAVVIMSTFATLVSMLPFHTGNVFKTSLFRRKFRRVAVNRNAIEDVKICHIVMLIHVGIIFAKIQKSDTNAL